LPFSSIGDGGLRVGDPGDAAQIAKATAGPNPRHRRSRHDAPYSTEAIQAAHDEWYKLAFGVKSFDYEILGEHAAVLDRVTESAEQSVHQREYFPRRPMLLPSCCRH
jgi:hypothetical protein